MATVESPAGAYSGISPERYADKDELLDAVRDLYRRDGIKALATPFLERQRFNLYQRLLAAGISQAVLLDRLGLTEEYADWKQNHRTYRGVTKPKWSWDRAIAVAMEIVEREGDLRNVEEYRRSGLSSLVSAVFKAGKTWEDLRVAVGLPPSPKFWPSRNGMRWRSRPEACLSNFLYARGIEHRRGERYPAEYSEQSGRRWGQYDLHFLSVTGVWIDVEVWGDSLNKMSGGRYHKTRQFKEEFQAKRPNFLGIPYLDCLKGDVQLSKILEPFVGVIEPFVFDKTTDRAIETSHWSDADDLLETCRKMASNMPDGIFPSEDWLRKRGKYKNRSGTGYNTLALRVNQWLGGTRNVRRLLGQDHASTTEWTRENVVAAWQAFEKKYGLTPSQCKGANGRKLQLRSVVAEGAKIYEAARRLGVVETAKGGRTARKTMWTPEFTLAQWTEFTRRHGRTPVESIRKSLRQTLPREVRSEAIRIYDAARRLGILEQAKGNRPNSGE